MATRAPGEAEEPGFRVTDRRRMGREGPEPGGAAQGPGAEGSEPTRQPEGGVQEGDLHFPAVPDLLRVFISEMYARALVHMGLMVNPATNLLAKDLPQARLAIDCIGSLLEHLGPLAEEGERGELERMLADLRINFVRQSRA